MTRLGPAVAGGAGAWKNRGLVNGIHDMGGMHGFGRIEAEADEPVFHERWEARVFGVVMAVLGTGIDNIDAIRHAIEDRPPDEYLRLGYYGRWLAAFERRLEAKGILRPGELEARLEGKAVPASEAPPAHEPALPGAKREGGSPPAFSPGDVVRAKNHQPCGHTRLPAYVRGRRGVVEDVYGSWVFPDTNAHGLGENPESLYRVRFDPKEIWGDAAEPGTSLTVDLFESYLEKEGS